MGKTVNINEGKPNQELAIVRMENHYDVFCDMNFPPENEGSARGLFNHIKGLLPKATSPDDMVGFVEIHQCGHRQGLNCPSELKERYEVE